MSRLTPQELGSLLNLAAKAPSTVGETFALGDVLRRAIELAGQPHDIAAQPPTPLVSPHPSVVEEYLCSAPIKAGGTD